MPSKRNAVKSNDSTVNLLRLFNVQPNHHVVTRQDLTRDYGKNSSTSRSSSSTPSSSDDAITSINNYYTWNSSKTNAPIHKERAAIMSALHSTTRSVASSYPSLPSWPRPSKSFTRSHRVRDIVSMCQDGGSSFSSEEYHNGETSTVEPDGWPRVRPDHENPSAVEGSDNEREPLFGMDNSRCWSCSATDGSDDGQVGNNSYYSSFVRPTATKDDVDDDEEAETPQETNRQQSSLSSWRQKLSRLMFNNKKRQSR